MYSYAALNNVRIEQSMGKFVLLLLLLLVVFYIVFELFLCRLILNIPFDQETCCINEIQFVIKHTHTQTENVYAKMFIDTVPMHGIFNWNS